MTTYIGFIKPPFARLYYGVSIGILSMALPVASIAQEGDAEKILINNSDVCQTSYDATTQTLNIPCVNLNIDNNIVSYNVTLKQISANNSKTFSLLNTKKNEHVLNSDCTADYQVETKHLHIPCIGEDENNNVGLDIYYDDNTNLLNVSPMNNRRSRRAAVSYKLPFLGGTSHRTSRTTAHGNTYGDYYAIDFVMPVGTDVVASAAGVVKKIKENSDTGCASTSCISQANYVIITHDDNTETLYLHLQYNGVSVNVGDRVKQGQKIGKSGSTGYSTGPHLHFQRGEQCGPTRWYCTPTKQMIFDDVSGGEVSAYTTYKSGNYQQSISTKVITGSFDGAGSLVESSTNSYGANKDTDAMQAHTINPSTVVYQWKKDANCHHIDITGDIGKVLIHAKPWSEHLTTEVYEANLPVSVTGDSTWNLVTVTSSSKLSSTKYIDATCKPSSSSLKRTGYVNKLDSNFENNLVALNNDYYLTGNGSLISNLGTGVGKNQDWAITFEKHKSLTVFQWYTNGNSCKNFSVKDSGGNSVQLSGDNQVAFKPWSGEDWIDSSCRSLPCSFSAPNAGYWIVKIKTNAGAVPSGQLHAQCN